jgi:phospholipid-binding lipoprotein MlaA
MNLLHIFIALTTLAVTGCATHANNPSDPLEPFNRGVYKFNDTLDKAVAKPVAQGYNKVMPVTGKILVTNFFSNLNDVIVTLNDLLQFKFTQGFSDGMRVLVNSTIGIGGLVDVASMHLEKHNEDFGQTLGYWGINSGPYLMLPVFGPSSFRDGIGLYADSYASPIYRGVPKIRTRNQLYLTNMVNRRAQLLADEKIMEGAMLDRYAFIRDAYLQRRQSLVYDGNPPHDPYEDDSLDAEDESVPSAPPATPSQPPAAP